MFDAVELRLILLHLLGEAPRHGYELIRAIEELSGGHYAPSPGVVYPTLTLLDEMGLVEEEASAGARRTYRLSDAGRAHLAENRALADAALARLKDLAGTAERIDPAPVRRAMDNLSTVLRQRLNEDSTDRSALLDIAALIDEAASKIERM
jgi:DNA-binding PadR family transcriptional regulator